MAHRIVHRSAFGLVMAVVVAACGGSPRSTSVPNAVGSPASTSSSTCPEGATAAPSAAASRAIPTLEGLLRGSSEILIGTMTGTGPPAWDTPGGREPTAADLERYPGVHHPVVIEVEQTLRGDPDGALLVLEYGGRIGCGPVASSSESVYLYPGQRSVFFLGHLEGFRNEAFLGARGVWDVWPIDADGLIQGHESLALNDFVGLIAAASGPPDESSSP